MDFLIDGQHQMSQPTLQYCVRYVSILSDDFLNSSQYLEAKTYFRVVNIKCKNIWIKASPKYINVNIIHFKILYYFSKLKIK